MKHTLKNLLALCLAFLMLTALALPAAADVIWEPNDLFYTTHADECTYIRYRRYLTNSEAGYVYQYQSPVSSVTTAAHSNGEEISLAWLYTADDGEVWGLPSDESGWFKLSELSLIYDCREFLNDHEAELVSYSAEDADPIPASDATPVIGWTYPGGEKCESITYAENVAEFIGKTYTDDNESVWGYIGYMYGMRDFWVCLTAPYDEGAGGYAVAEHEITLKQSPVPAEEIPVNRGNITVGIVAGVLIVLVVIGTVTLIRVMFGKKRKQ